MNATTFNPHKDLANFREAKEIALSIKEGHYRRPSGQNPFCGANFKGIGRIVIWELGDPATKAVAQGTIEMNNSLYGYRKAEQFTILEK